VATKQDKDRMGTLKEHVPCIACLLTINMGYRLPTIHHLTSGFRRRGHQETVPLCAWHHQGDTECYSKQEIMGILGPSYAHGRRGFEEVYGGDDTLLAVTNKILFHFGRDPWLDYDLPEYVRRDAIELWREMARPNLVPG
jgi:hypothetical protein